jgi:hypothetical protein
MANETKDIYIAVRLGSEWGPYVLLIEVRRQDDEAPIYRVDTAKIMPADEAEELRDLTLAGMLAGILGKEGFPHRSIDEPCLLEDLGPGRLLYWSIAERGSTGSVVSATLLGRIIAIAHFEARPGEDLSLLALGEIGQLESAADRPSRSRRSPA